MKNPRQWWKFAGIYLAALSLAYHEITNCAYVANAVMKDASKKKQIWSLEYLKEMRLNRNRYVELYKRKKQRLEKKKNVRFLKH